MPIEFDPPIEHLRKWTGTRLGRSDGVMNRLPDYGPRAMLALDAHEACANVRLVLWKSREQRAETGSYSCRPCSRWTSQVTG